MAERSIGADWYGCALWCGGFTGYALRQRRPHPQRTQASNAQAQGTETEKTAAGAAAANTANTANAAGCLLCQSGSVADRAT
jgi:hypothetical protein